MKTNPIKLSKLDNWSTKIIGLRYGATEMRKDNEATTKLHSERGLFFSTGKHRIKMEVTNRSFGGQKDRAAIEKR